MNVTIAVRPTGSDLGVMTSAFVFAWFPESVRLTAVMFSSFRVPTHLSDRAKSVVLQTKSPPPGALAGVLTDPAGLQKSGFSAG